MTQNNISELEKGIEKELHYLVRAILGEPYLSTQAKIVIGDCRSILLNLFTHYMEKVIGEDENPIERNMGFTDSQLTRIDKGKSARNDFRAEQRTMLKNIRRIKG